MANNISTPIYDFVNAYANSDVSRLHMPGHKGRAFLGFEQFDITEVDGADSLYEASGIIKESEQNATEIFGSGQTLYATGGSSQCIGAMLYLALLHFKQKSNYKDRPVVIAARNAHKAFIHAATLLDFDVVWLWPELSVDSICSCPISVKQVEDTLQKYQGRVISVYLTSPDYLGGLQDIGTIAKVCHQYDTLLTVDNAHGAYLHFLDEGLHPMDLGADICSDSAHKTLPVLTGGAYLHISKDAPEALFAYAKYALSLFGSTSPSYLTMASLDLCNRYLTNSYSSNLMKIIAKTNAYKVQLEEMGWEVLKTEPLKIVLKIPTTKEEEIANRLQTEHVVWEYLDSDYVVFMLTPENTEADLERIKVALGINKTLYSVSTQPVLCRTKQVASVREALLSLGEEVTLENAIHRICRVPTVSCPPAIPIAVPGERITEEMINVFRHYGVTKIDVVKNNGVE